MVSFDTDITYLHTFVFYLTYFSYFSIFSTRDNYYRW